MDTGEIFTKTAKGQEEIRTRACRLDARHRALLIVVDGHRTVRDLAGMAGGGDIAAMLGHLLSLELVESTRATATLTGTQTAAPPQAPAGDAAASGSGDWKKTRDAVRDLVLDLLGPDGEFLAMKLESIRSPDQLAPVLAGIRQALGELRGSKAAARLDQIIAG